MSGREVLGGEPLVVLEVDKRTHRTVESMVHVLSLYGFVTLLSHSHLSIATVK